MKRTNIKEFELDIEGMTCDSCAVHISKVLSNVKGVIDVHILDWRSEKAFVLVSSNLSTVESLRQAVEKASYTVKSIKQRMNPITNIAINENWDFDVAVIGTGGAGMGAAIKAAEEGRTVCIIEMGEIGGTCVNIGCIPSKTLIRATEILNKIHSSPFLEIKSKIELNWQKVLGWKNNLVNKLRNEKYVEVIQSYEQITLIRGKAIFNSNGALMVDNKKINAKKVIIATGSQPKIPPIFVEKKISVFTSTSIMELSKLPESLIIIGGRAIALELGQMLSNMGVDITIIQRSSRILPKHNPDVAMLLQKYLIESGMKIYTNTKILDVNVSKNEKNVLIEINGQRHNIVAKDILVATGRKPNTKGIGLENVGVELTDEGFIRVNEYMQTSNPRIYAAGDVTILPKFVYVAAMSGSIAAFNAIHGNSKKINLSVLPSVIFTNPELAMVGFTEEEAKKEGYETLISILNLNNVPYALTSYDTRGIIKLIADKRTNRLLGAHILCSNAGEIIQSAALIIYFGSKYDITIDEILELFFLYLVQVEALKLAMINLKKDISKLSCCTN
ncbi:MAG: mercury(II) reductase [Candidatus Heimdallarchaeaceae archaeon]